MPWKKPCDWSASSPVTPAYRSSSLSPPRSTRRQSTNAHHAWLFASYIMGQAASRQRGTPGETQTLLSSDLEEVEEVDHDHDGCYPRHGPHDICPANPYADLPVYTTIHRYVVGLKELFREEMADLVGLSGFGGISSRPLVSRI
jgi:hypothetical protein